MMEVKEAKPKDYRQRLVNICLYYAPQKMHLIDGLLRKFKGKEEVLMATLQRGYGPEPTVQQLKAAVAQRTHSSPPAGAVPQKRPASVQPAQTVATTPLKPITVAEARVRVARYYIKYNPMKLTELDTILNTYKGQEAQLMADLKEKYGPEPEENEVNTIRHYAREFFSMPTDVRLSSRDRLIRFYIKYAPQRIPEVDKILQGYQGQENRMWFDLVEKYGPEPSLHELNIVANESENKKTYRARVVNLYQKYCPEKLLQVDAGLARHKGREDQMIQDLVRKYGPEPTDAELVQMARTGKCGHFSAQGSFRQRLINMYAFYKPEYMNRVDYGLEKYAGQEEELMGTLVRVYGPEPTRQQLDALYGNDELDFYRTQPGAQVMGACPYCAKPLTSATPGEGCCPMRASLCNRIRYMYLEHQHDKYLTVEDVLAAYNGCEEDLLNMLIAKYGPEPDAHTYTTLDALAHELITQSQQASVHASPVTQDAFQQTQLLPDAGDSERCAEDIEFEKQLKELCEVYCPEYLGDISDWIVRYRDQKEDLLSYLRKTYVSTGTEPRKLGQQEHQIGQMLCLVHQQRLDYRTRIANMYLKYRSENLAYLDEDLETYKNFEEDYLMALVCTYGPEPPLGWKPSVPSPYSEYALI